MAKTANSKVIFLPATNQTVQQQLAEADKHGEGPSSYADYNNTGSSSNNEFGTGIGSAMNARVIENM